MLAAVQELLVSAEPALLAAAVRLVAADSAVLPPVAVPLAALVPFSLVAVLLHAAGSAAPLLVAAVQGLPAELEPVAEPEFAAAEPMLPAVLVAPEYPVEPAVAIELPAEPTVLKPLASLIPPAAKLRLPVALQESVLHQHPPAAQPPERQPEALQIETPASEPGIPAEVFHRSVP